MGCSRVFFLTWPRNQSAVRSSLSSIDQQIVNHARCGAECAPAILGGRRFTICFFIPIDFGAPDEFFDPWWF